MTVAHTSEPARRSGDGIDVSLLWARLTDTLSVLVGDLRTGAFFQFTPPRDKGLDDAPEDAGFASLASRAPVHA
jgi:hypothetical protein